MSMLLGPLPGTRAAGLNPISKVLAMVALTVPLLLTTDVVTSGVIVAGEVAGLAALGLLNRSLLRLWPILVSLATLWLGNWAVSGSFDGLGAVTIRLFALGLSGYLLLASTDPCDLADALVQRWHAPARFAFGALAAFRLLPLLAGELDTMRRARRARGIDAGANPVAFVRLAANLVFGLLVQGVRRAVRLAAAMDARGFGAGERRSFARPSELVRADRVLVGCAVLLCAVAVSISVLTGHWIWLFS